MNKLNSFRLGTKIMSAMYMAILLCDVSMLLFLNFTGDSMKWNAILLVVLLLALYSTIYSCVWKEGYREKNRVQCGFSQEDLLMGLKAGGIAIIPHYLLVALMIALRFFGVNMSGLYRLINFFAIVLINAIMDPALPIQEIEIWRILISTCFIAVVPLVSWAAYIMGYKRISIMEMLVYRRKAEAPTREEASKINKRKK